MLSEIMDLDKTYYMNTFGARLPVAFERGRGLTLISTEGKEYKDFLGGIAVNALGHSHPVFIRRMKEQLDRLIHTSNLYYIENQARLAQKLAEHSAADRVFFANSGAEANEGAFKLAKIYYYKQQKNKFEIITLDSSFHGRTLATVAATGQEKYQKPYKPLTPGFIQVEPNNLDAVKNAVTEHTAAIMVELIQGESGVHPMDQDYIQGLRKLCDEQDILLIFDEVQTGMGRTGYMFAHQMYGVEPDIFTAAKALGNGIPIGAVCAKEFVAQAFAPGDHGSTFGGGPLATAAGLAVFDIIEEEHILENVQAVSAYFMAQLKTIQKNHAEKVLELRNAGLLIGIELEPSAAKQVFDRLFDLGILTSLCGGTTIRLAPPLNITNSDVDAFIEKLNTALSE